MQRHLADHSMPILASGLNLAALALLPMFLGNRIAETGLYFLSLGCFLGHVAYLSTWSVWSRQGWFARVLQTNLLLLCGWSIIRVTPLSPAGNEATPFLLPLGAFCLVFLHTLYDSLYRRRWQLTMRAAFWWTTVFALMATAASTGAPGQGMQALLLICFQLFLMACFVAFASVLTLVVHCLRRSVLDKVLLLLLVCLTGATLPVIVLGGLSVVTGDTIGSSGQLFLDALYLNAGVIGMLTGSLMLSGRGRLPWGPFPNRCASLRGIP